MSGSGRSSRRLPRSIIKSKENRLWQQEGNHQSAAEGDVVAREPLCGRLISSSICRRPARRWQLAADERYHWLAAAVAVEWRYQATAQSGSLTAKRTNDTSAGWLLTCVAHVLAPWPHALASRPAAWPAPPVSRPTDRRADGSTNAISIATATAKCRCLLSCLNGRRTFQHKHICTGRCRRHCRCGAPIKP